MNKKGQMSFDYNERIASLSEDDFFAQIKRTVGGQRISEEQFQIILNDIKEALEFNSQDVLLDLCCGNAHLSSHFFELISIYTGVDSSNALIDIAKKYFNNEKTNYIASDLIEYLKSEKNPAVYTKILICSSIQYFAPEMVKEILSIIKEKFINVERMLITPIPDKDKAELFFGKERLAEQDLDDYTSSLGRFYSPKEIEDLAKIEGFSSAYIALNEKAHNAHYRYAVLLKPIK